MKKSTKIKTLLGMAAATAGTIAAVTPAFGVTIDTLSGTLPDENTIAYVDFTVPVAPAINFKTTSYASGNFSPVLYLFDGSGNFINEFTDSGDLDFNLPDRTVPTLAPGNYRAVISAFGISNGVGTTFSTRFDTTGGTFFGRNPEYALTISTVDTPTAVPEPSSIIGTTLAGVGVVLVRRKLVSDRRNRRK